MILLVIGLLIGVTWAAASPGVSRWLPWLGPLAYGGLALGLWRSEVDDRSDQRQPGLVAVVGLVGLGVLVFGVLAGYVIRKRRTG